MLDWVFKSIEYFNDRKNLNLIIRVHPAEIRGLVPSNQKLVEEINKRFRNIPNNIIIIPPESQISTYAVMEKCNAVIISNRFIDEQKVLATLEENRKKPVKKSNWQKRLEEAAKRRGIQPPRK